MSASNAKKKVLFTSHTANFQKFNRSFMRWFREQNWEVYYASSGEEEVLDTDKHFDVPFERNPFKLNNFRAYKQLKKIINEGSYNIIHTHTPVGSVVTRLAARKARKKQLSIPKRVVRKVKKTLTTKREAKARVSS